MKNNTISIQDNGNIIILDAQSILYVTLNVNCPSDIAVKIPKTIPDIFFRGSALSGITSSRVRVNMEFEDRMP